MTDQGLRCINEAVQFIEGIMEEFYQRRRKHWSRIRRELWVALNNPHNPQKDVGEGLSFEMRTKIRNSRPKLKQLRITNAQEVWGNSNIDLRGLIMNAKYESPYGVTSLIVIMRWGILSIWMFLALLIRKNKPLQIPNYGPNRNNCDANANVS